MQVHFKAVGCRLNEAEVEAWAKQFLAGGHSIANKPEAADILVFNSCAVTQQAVRTSRQFLRRMKRENPAAKLVVSGCYATLDAEETADLLGVELVVPNEKKDQLPELASEAFGFELKPTAGLDPDGTTLFERGRQRAFVKIQDGCRHHCSYCIVTIARGEERSRSIAEIISEINKLVECGIKEVILTGVHVGGYGSDINASLIQLVEAVLQDTDIPRLRFASVEPWDLPEHFFTLFSNPRLMPHMHLPLQSGSDRILKHMARRCSTSDFYRLIEQAREAVPEFNVTTDIIVGFPGETEVEWQETLAYVEKIGFGHIHIFSFSPREGTKAARFPNQLTGDVKRARSKQLHELARQSKESVNTQFIGRECQVLWEGDGKLQDNGLHRFGGYTPSYSRVYCDVPEGYQLSNELTSAELIRLDKQGDIVTTVSKEILKAVPVKPAFPKIWMRERSD